MVATNDVRAAATEYRKLFSQWIKNLANETDEVRRSERFRAWFDTAVRFWRYSPLNRLVILLQNKAATRVAGPRVWERYGRIVKDGENPIKILAPAQRLFSRAFVLVDVYDVAQTEGAPIGDVDLELMGPSSVLGRVEAAARVLGFTVREVEPRDAAGWLGRSFGQGRIEIRQGIAPAQRLAALLHEYAHEVLHAPCDRREHGYARLEAEVEGVTFLISKVLGEQSTAPAYLAWQGATGAMLRTSLRRISLGAQIILSAIVDERRIERTLPPIEKVLSEARRPEAKASTRRRRFLRKPTWAIKR